MKHKGLVLNSYQNQMHITEIWGKYPQFLRKWGFNLEIKLLRQFMMQYKDVNVYIRYEMLDVFRILRCSKTPLKVRVGHHRVEWNLPLPCLAGHAVHVAPQHKAGPPEAGPPGHQGTGDPCSTRQWPRPSRVFLQGCSSSSHPPVWR